MPRTLNFATGDLFTNLSTEAGLFYSAATRLRDAAFGTGPIGHHKLEAQLLPTPWDFVSREDIQSHANRDNVFTGGSPAVQEWVDRISGLSATDFWILSELFLPRLASDGEYNFYVTSASLTVENPQAALHYGWAFTGSVLKLLPLTYGNQKRGIQLCILEDLVTDDIDLTIDYDNRLHVKHFIPISGISEISEDGFATLDSKSIFGGNVASATSNRVLVLALRAMAESDDAPEDTRAPDGFVDLFLYPGQAHEANLVDYHGSVGLLTDLVID